MLRQITELRNYVLEAEDGELGRCKDFLFDSRSWTARYMVADTRKWLPGRKVLIPPVSLGAPQWKNSRFPVKLTRRQVEESPSLEEDLPVSRRYEEQLLAYYHHPYYWIGPMTWGYHRMPPPVAAQSRSEGPVQDEISDSEAHLRSAAEVEGYRIQASDDGIGHVEDFLIDDSDWRIRYVVVDTVNWLPGRKVLVATEWFQDVSWPKQEIRVDLTRKQVKESPEFKPGAADRRYEETLFGHYRARPYWEARSQAGILKQGKTRLPPD
jgi:stress response protein YsnF